MVDSAQFENALSRGSIRKWHVAEDYAIEDGLLVEKGDPTRTRSYFPFAYPELVVEFAKLRCGDESAILEFARERGSLGFPEPQDSAGEHLNGEPLALISKHADQINKIITLVDLKRQEEGEKLSEAISNMCVAGDYDNFFVFEFMLVTGDMRRVSQTFTNGEHELHLSLPDQPGFPPVDNSLPVFPLPNLNIPSLPSDYRTKQGRNLVLADIIIQEVINRNIDFLPMKLVMPQFGLLVRSYIYERLITVIYAHLADAVVGERSFVRCAYCGSFFEQTEKRQRYCPPVTPKGDSLCSLRARKDRYFNRKRKKEGS